MRPQLRLCALVASFGLALGAAAPAQTSQNLKVLEGLAPFAALPNSASGKAALASNFTITASIQHGTANQPGLTSFALQQEQALEDAFITGANASELADGLGTKLGNAYRSLASYSSSDDGKTSTFSSVSPSLAKLIAGTAAVTGSDSASAKFFFANQTTGADRTPVSPAAAAVLRASGGVADAYGVAYDRVAGSTGADPFGDSRPFQTEPDLLAFTGTDYFGVPSSNERYLRGPIQDLTQSPSFPSGHTTYGYTESLLLAILVPQRYPQMIVRAAEYGNDRIVLGAHYAMDVIAGRTLAYFDVAALLANPGPELAAARTDLSTALEAACGASIETCAAKDAGRFSDAARDEAFYESTQTYGLPAVYGGTPAIEDVGNLAPEAGHLLTAAFPALSLDEADRILTQTEGPAGGFLDNGTAFGVYSRLDLYRASIAARAAARSW